MKHFAKRCLALLMALVMIAGLTPAMRHTAHADHDHAATASTQTVEYKYSGSYLYNWGKRGTTATFLSPKAEAFYTTTYEQLSILPGSADINSTPSSALYNALQDLMESKHTHVTTYDETRTQYQYTDCENNGTPDSISSFYSGNPIGPAWDAGATWNREHTWPKSKSASGSSTSTDRENDLMMLRPTAASENGSRSNKAYGVSAGYFDPNTFATGGLDVRGDVARTLLYVYVRWGGDSAKADGALNYMWGTNGVIESKEVLLDWMFADPVDTWELGRNDAVEAITGTRNVFVDYPELAFLLFGAQVPASITTPSGKGSGGCQHSYSSTVTKPANCTETGTRVHTCSKCGVSYNETIPANGHNYVGGTCTVCGDTANIKYIRIYHPTSGKYMTATASGSRLSPGTKDQAAIWTVTINKDGQYSFAYNGKYLTSGSTGGSLSLASSLSDLGLWVIEDAGSGNCYIRNLSANYNGNSQYVEYYQSNFTTYGFNSSYISDFTMKLEEVVLCENGHTWTPATCQAPKTCSVCGVKEGEVGDHNYVDGTCTVCGEEDLSTLVPTLVTNVSSLKVGDQIIIVAKNANKALGTEQRSNNRGSATITKSSNTLTYGSDTQIITLEAGTANGTFAFNVGNGYLYAAGGNDSNYLRTQSTPGATGSWTITIDASGTATIKAGGSGSRNQLRFNSANNPQIFSCYASGQDDVAIYKFAASCNHNWTEATCQAPKTCTKCGAVEGEVADHNFVDGTCTVCGEVEEIAPTWVRVNLEDIAPTDTVTITMTKGNTTWALYNANGTGSAPKAVVVTVDGDTMVAPDNATISWNISSTSSGLIIYKAGSTSTWLYSTSTNNGTRVGTNSAKYWKVDSASGYLKHVGTNRYLGVYTTNPDWRAYTNTTGNTAGQKLSFWKFVCTHKWVDADCCNPKTCTRCGATEGEALDHNLVDGACTRCDAHVRYVHIYYPSGKNYITATASGNKLTAGNLSKAAVFTMTPSKGYYTFSCNGKYLTAGSTGNSLTLSSTLSQYGLWVIEDAGSGKCYLRNANAVYNGKYQYLEYYNNLFTTYGFDATKKNIFTFELACSHNTWAPATCTTPKTCTYCGVTEGDPLGHSYTNRVSVLPTCTTNGTRVYTCTVCGDTYNTLIPAFGHNMVNGTCTNCSQSSIVPPSGGIVVGPCTGGEGCPLHNFVDVTPGAWYHEGMEYCVNAGLINGLPGGKLAPTGLADRAQIITMLWRLAGKPVVNNDVQYDDMEADSWYTLAVRWATASGITGGYGNGTFGTADAVTREQLVTMLYRMAGSPAVNGSHSASFPDADDVSSWAEKAMNWAISVGLITGTGAGELNPNGTASRAEVATMLMRFAKGF